MISEDFEVVIPKTRNVSIDKEELSDEIDEPINEISNPLRIRNQAENDYEILDEDSISDWFFKKYK